MKNFLLTILMTAVVLAGCAQKKDYVVTIKTRHGDMVAILYDETPKHKENFIKLAKAHYFDSLLFHRVIDGFMIQGGDPESKKAKAGQRLGNGGPGYTVEAEILPQYFHARGALAAARLGDQMNPQKASSGSQFYIVQGRKLSKEELTIDRQKMDQAYRQFFQNPENAAYRDTLAQFYQNRDLQGYENYLKRMKPVVEKQLNISIDKTVSPEVVEAYTTLGGAPDLDGQYTVFGKVIQGLEVIDKIAKEVKDPMDRPKDDVRMTVTVEELPVKKIEKLYGYTYPEKKK